MGRGSAELQAVLRIGKRRLPAAARQEQKLIKRAEQEMYSLQEEARDLVHDYLAAITGGKRRNLLNQAELALLPITRENVTLLADDDQPTLGSLKVANLTARYHLAARPDDDVGSWQYDVEYVVPSALVFDGTELLERGDRIVFNSLWFPRWSGDRKLKAPVPEAQMLAFSEFRADIEEKMSELKLALPAFAEEMDELRAASVQAQDLDRSLLHVRRSHLAARLLEG